MEIKDIKNPDFLKNLNNKELENLATDIRKFILDNVSKTGGHLSSNLGIVDLTIAMLKVFDANKDIIIFDVGHECYTYKILTGRANKFTTLRKMGGLSGFQSINESIYDKYEAGHSGTSISAGEGFAIARDLDKKKYNVISVIGDGSIGNGLSYEALNQIGDLQNKQIIILNDNQMSISKNVGAIHNMLDSIRSHKGYNDAKKNTKNILSKTFIGKKLSLFVHKLKNIFKRIYTRKGEIFSDFDIDYYGPIHGHDYNELLRYLTIAKNSEKSVILHVITQKGKGYKYAEEDKIGKFHGISAFDINTGEVINKNNLPSYSEIMSSYVYNYAKKDKDIICITPGMCYGSKLDIISEKLPKQYIDTGIAEEHALILANSLALSNKKPYLFIYSTFLQRGYDMLVHDIARMNSDVTLLIDRAGIIPSDGISHQGVFDIPMMLSIPNMVISMPKDAKEANDLIFTSLNYKGPFAIRYPKINIKYDYSKGNNIKIGSWEVLKDGSDAIIISYGDFVNKALDISSKLENNISLMIINARYIKPIDNELLEKISKLNKPIIVYEESMEIGSLGSLISQKLPNNKVYTKGIKDEFLTHATRDELIKLENLDEDSMIKYIKNIIKK